MSAPDLPVVPAVRTGSGWWLSTAAGAIRITDAAFHAELEDGARAVALAEQAIAAISSDDGAHG